MNIEMNIEINITYRNLGLLLLFLCNLGLIHGHLIRFCGSLFIRCCFSRKRSKAGDCVQSQLTNLSRIKRTVNTDTKGTEQSVPFTEVSVL